MTVSYPSRLLALPILLTRLASALQVTPNSPCSSLCIDNASLDPSDPNSSNTYNSDIVCSDDDYASSPVGVKWQNCMSCLQNSTFSQGTENDQMWFLYNMRYNVDYCLFGFPNATGVGTSPCTTSMACGPLEGALEDGNLDAHDLVEYSYCSANGSAMTGDFYDRCLGCVSAGGDTNYLANYLVALEAGCLQEPAPGGIVGLNGSVFSTSLIGIVNPSNQTSHSSSDGPHLSPTIIIPVVIGGLLVVAAIAGFIFIRYRKRANRRARAQGGDFLNWRHRRKSSLSFRCQTQMGPLTPKFFPGTDDSSIDEMTYAHTQHNARGDLQGDFNGADKSSIWNSRMSISSFPDGASIMTEKGQEKQSQRRAITSNRPPHALTTSFPSAPPSVHQSPPSGSIMRFSPDSFTSPASAASARSTTQMLPAIKPYNPADHRPTSTTTLNFSPAAAARLADQQPFNFSFSSPVSASTASPLLKHQHGWQPPAVASFTPAPPPPDRRRETGGGGGGGAFPFPPPPPPPRPPPKNIGPRLVPHPTPSRVKKGKAVVGLESGSPVESREIKVAFEPPPPR